MSSSIWTRCAGTSNARPLRLLAWRAVEGQHVVSTRKLVDSDDEQRVLEDLLEASKPPLAPDEQRAGLHYLLFTPFRYPPLRWGSRFGTRAERGIWYGSRAVRTCFAEVAYYRLLFLEGTTADLSPLIVDLTAFQASIRARRGIDLTAPPFDAHEEVLASRTDYAETQRLGAAMRADGIEAFVFRSARDARGGANVAVLRPTAFGAKAPKKSETWVSVATKSAVEMTRKDLLSARQTLRYPRGDFEVDGALPRPSA